MNLKPLDDRIVVKPNELTLLVLVSTSVPLPLFTVPNPLVSTGTATVKVALLT